MITPIKQKKPFITQTIWTRSVNTGGRWEIAEGGYRRQLILRENATQGLHDKCSFLYLSTYICFISYMYIHIYVIHMYTCIFVCTYWYILVYSHKRIRVCVCACVNIPPYTHDSIHTKKRHLNWQPESKIVLINNFYHWNLEVMYVCIDRRMSCMSCVLNMRRCMVDFICVQRQTERERERGRDWKRERRERDRQCNLKA